MKVKFNGGIKDVPLTEVTAANYIVPQREEKFYHVLQEKVEFDRNTGKRKSRPVLQKYDTKAWVNTSKYLRDAGYQLTILHDPTVWQQAQEKAQQQRAAQQAAQRAALDAKRAAAERKALKDELRKEVLEELKAELKESKKPKK